MTYDESMRGSWIQRKKSGYECGFELSIMAQLDRQIQLYDLQRVDAIHKTKLHACPK